MSARHLVELCAGTAAVSLCAIAGHPVQPITGYMGGKRRWAPRIVSALGFDTFRRPGRVLLVDGGPWGEVWASVQRDRRAVVRALGDLAVIFGDDACAAWPILVAEPPAHDLAERVARYLVMQARSANCIPVWWDGERWTSPTGARQRQNGRVATQQGSRRLGPAYMSGAMLRQKSTSRAAKSRGLVKITTLAARVAALPDMSRVDVIHGDVRDVDPIPGAAMYIDPPYLHAPRYARLLPRADVLAIIDRWRAAGCRVVASEGEPLGGETIPLAHPRGKAEVLSVWEAA